MKEVSLREVMAEIEALDRELWRSRLKCLIELLASSCLLIFWINIYFGKMYFPTLWRAMIAMQPILNACAWMIWVMPSLYWHRPTYIDIDDNWREGLEGTLILKRYEMRIYNLAKQKRSERMIDLLTASQFIILAALVAARLILMS